MKFLNFKDCQFKIIGHTCIWIIDISHIHIYAKQYQNECCYSSMHITAQVLYSGFPLNTTGTCITQLK